jgi:hypothetical protein
MLHIASHATSHAAASLLLPHKLTDCPILIAMIIDPLVGRYDSQWQLCAPEYAPDYVWSLATALWLSMLYTAIRGVERFNDQNARITGTTAHEDYEMVDMRSRR